MTISRVASRTRTVACSGALLAVLTLAGCASASTTGSAPSPDPVETAPSSPAAPETPAVTDPATSAPTTTSPAPTCTPFGSTQRASSAQSTMSTQTGQSMRVGEHDCYDRFVFELQGSGPAPGWTVGYVDQLAGQGSGDAIALRGDADLEVMVQVWTVDDFAGRPAEWPAFTGADRIYPGLTAIKEVRNLYAHEGQTQIGIGVDTQRPFRVSYLTKPARLVVDVYTG